MPTAFPSPLRATNTVTEGSAICSTVSWNWNSRGVNGIM
jgi:hypothetical protein